jgi:hypothetical protein
MGTKAVARATGVIAGKAKVKARIKARIKARGDDIGYDRN